MREFGHLFIPHTKTIFLSHQCKGVVIIIIIVLCWFGRFVKWNGFFFCVWWCDVMKWMRFSWSGTRALHVDYYYTINFVFSIGRSCNNQIRIIGWWKVLCTRRKGSTALSFYLIVNSVHTSHTDQQQKLLCKSASDSSKIPFSTTKTALLFTQFFFLKISSNLSIYRRCTKKLLKRYCLCIIYGVLKSVLLSAHQQQQL